MPVTLECEFCGKQFRVSPYYARRGQRYCSKECCGIASRQYPEPLVAVRCNQCGRPIIRSAGKAERNAHNFCSWDCYAEWRKGKFTGEDNVCWKGGRIPYGEGWTETVRKNVRERDDFRCQVCGKSAAENSRELDVHHIVSSREGGLHTIDNLITVCPSCHAKLDKLGHRR